MNWTDHSNSSKSILGSTSVTGSSGTAYTCFPESDFCTCPFYKFSVMRKEEFVLCKHAIASRLALCFETCKDVEVSPADFATLLLEI